jgi:hypothetical protein
MRGIAVFHEAITKIMPADRKQNPWARSNFHKPQAKTADKTTDKTTDKAKDKATGSVAVDPIALFQSAREKSWKPLFEFFLTITMKGKIGLLLGNDRAVSMNFMPITNEDCGTIEFRRPPGVKTAAAAKRWTAFTMGFVRATMEPGWHDKWSSKKNGATVSDLQDFVKMGLGLLGWSSFVDTRTFVEDHSTATPLSAFSHQEIKRKMAKAANEGEFEKKVGSLHESRLFLCDPFSLLVSFLLIFPSPLDANKPHQMVHSRQNSPASSQPGSPRSVRSIPATTSRPGTPTQSRPPTPSGHPESPSPAKPPQKKLAARPKPTQ